ncbi:hypothetical protein G6F57_019550 [Rhizopus arrhizus]|nr:hypothetical protein G6F57_019550 [Rhizopus arrhizus]
MDRPVAGLRIGRMAVARGRPGRARRPVDAPARRRTPPPDRAGVRTQDRRGPVGRARRRQRARVHQPACAAHDRSRLCAPDRRHPRADPRRRALSGQFHASAGSAGPGSAADDPPHERHGPAPRRSHRRRAPGPGIAGQRKKPRREPDDRGPAAH